MASLRYRNPVYGAYFADPFVWREGSDYFAVGTGAEEAAGSPAERIFPLLHSADLVQWQPIGGALQRPDPALGDSFWAPEVARCDGNYFLYYSVGHGDRQHQLRVAVGDKPSGPYRDCGRPLTDLARCAFAIDAHPFRDRDGGWYLFHARDFLDCSDGVRAGTALVVQRLEGMTRLLGEPHVVLRARCDWQRYRRARPMYGAVYDWHTLEGPSVILREGRYYCFYSGGCWQDDSYGVDYAVAADVLGPYRDDGNTGHPRILRSRPGVVGPGHNSIVIGPDGHTQFLVYHAWDQQHRERRMCLDVLSWQAGRPHCDGPTSDWVEIH